MPFSRYKTPDSSLMDAMRAAFYRVCDVLQLSYLDAGSPTALRPLKSTGAENWKAPHLQGLFVTR
jgi:hypothetical protein